MLLNKLLLNGSEGGSGRSPETFPSKTKSSNVFLLLLFNRVLLLNKLLLKGSEGSGGGGGGLPESSSKKNSSNVGNEGGAPPRPKRYGPELLFLILLLLLFLFIKGDFPFSFCSLFLNLKLFARMTWQRFNKIAIRLLFFNVNFSQQTPYYWIFSIKC